MSNIDSLDRLDPTYSTYPGSGDSESGTSRRRSWIATRVSRASTKDGGTKTHGIGSLQSNNAVCAILSAGTRSCALCRSPSEHESSCAPYSLYSTYAIPRVDGGIISLAPPERDAHDQFGCESFDLPPPQPRALYVALCGWIPCRSVSKHPSGAGQWKRISPVGSLCVYPLGGEAWCATDGATSGAAQHDVPVQRPRDASGLRQELSGDVLGTWKLLDGGRSRRNLSLEQDCFLQ